MDLTILVPLDGSKESEALFGALQEELSSGSELILLKVIGPARTQVIGEHLIDASQLEASERAQGLSYLREAAQRLGGDATRWRCEVVVGESFAQAIVDFAEREKVDSIVMYSHDRKGLSRLIKGSVARDVQRRALLDVKVVGRRELAGVA